MGTTITPNLGLIKPDEDEKIREDLPSFAGWTAHNENNCDKLDSLFRKTTHSWTPAWTTDVASNPVLGTGGFLEGKWFRIWPRMVFGYVRMFAGTASFSTGTGLYRFSLPPVAVPAEFAGMNFVIPVGKAYLHDADSVANSSVMVVLYDIGSGTFIFRRSDGDFWRSTAPITMAINDRLSFYFMYPTDTA